MPIKQETPKTPLPKANEWIKKEGYETRLLANAQDMNTPGTEAQLVRFHRGKYSHYHKIKTEFFYFTAGHGQVIINGQKIEIAPGKELLVKPKTNHEFINKSENPLEAVMFKTNNQPDDTFAK